MQTGTIINQYRIISAIGKGGMGEVFLAQDTKLDRKVAIKFLNEEFSKDADKLNRFIQEAKAVSALNHPNILTVYEIGENDESNFIVTEFIEGKTLREQLSPKQTNSLNAILKIAVQVSEALSAAHQAGIIHRDIKPENIMLRADGYAKVLDFGLAKLSEPEAVATGSIDLEDTTKGLVKTNPGMVMGTVSYMSPEQARGKETDGRTDLWSLGVVLYEMLAGKVPFSGETINHTIVSILEKEPHLLENVPDELQRIVRKALTKDKEMRYQTARDLLIDLKNLKRTLDIQGELERSIVPNREVTTDLEKENATQIYTEKSIEETKDEANAQSTQKVTTSSSLEYAVTQAKSHRVATAIIGIILLSIISAIVYLGFFANRSIKQIESIAVIPFVNESGSADVEYLSDGMTETLISSLSQLPNLSVKARSSVFRYKGKETNPQAIGKELNVQAIVNGRVVQRGNDLTLHVELVDTGTENVLWKSDYNRSMTNLVLLQSEIAQDVSSKLRAKLSGLVQQQIAKNYTENAEAYRLYLQGRFYWNKRKPDEHQKAIHYFEQAIALDPKYALAYSGIADCYAVSSSPEKGPQGRANLRAAANRALELDPTLGEPHAALASPASEELDWSYAEREYKKAIELNPNYPTAHQWYGEELTRLGRHEEAIAEIRRAQELDPLSLVINSDMIYILSMARRYDEAIEQGKKTLEIDSGWDFARSELVDAYIFKGSYEEALALVEKHNQNSNRTAQEKASIMQDIAKTRNAFRKSGAEGFWRQELELLKRDLTKGAEVSPFILAENYARLGEKDEAFKWLSKAVDENDLGDSGISLLKVYPGFDNLHSDPRFTELMKRMNLPH